MHHSIHHTIEGNQRIPLCGPQPLPTLTIQMLDASHGFYFFVEANLNDSSSVRSLLVFVRTLIDQIVVLCSTTQFEERIIRERRRG